MSMVIESKCEQIIDRYIRKSDKHRKKMKKQFILLLGLTDIILGDVISSIDLCICPYCKKVFKTKRGVYRHIDNVHKTEYIYDIRSVSNMYVNIKNRIIDNRIDIVFDVDGYPRHRFKSMKDLVKFIEINKNILENIKA